MDRIQRRQNMDPVINTRNQETIETIDFTREESEEGEDCPIGRKDNEHIFRKPYATHRPVP